MSLYRRKPKRVPPDPHARLGVSMVITLSELGNAVRTYRLRAKLSQYEVGVALRCSRSRISCLERGKTRHLTETDLRRLAVLFKIPPNRLRRLIPPPSPPPPLLPPLTPLAKLIRARREALGLSRMELAERLKTRSEYLCTLERTGRHLRYSLMRRLSRALDLPPERLAPFVEPDAGQPGNVLGWTIRERRKALGLSASMLGQLAGVSNTTVFAIEAGRVRLERGSQSRRTIEGLARGLQMDADILWDLRPPQMLHTSIAAADTLGGRVARQRIKRRWTQVELARRVGVIGTSICHLERNRICPHVSTLKRVANALGMAVAPLLRMTAKTRRHQYDSRRKGGNRRRDELKD